MRVLVGFLRGRWRVIEAGATTLNNPDTAGYARLEE
jgi:hypothetical protein